MSGGFWANTDGASSQYDITELQKQGGDFLSAFFLGKKECLEYWCEYFEAEDKEKDAVVELVDLLQGRFGDEITLGVEYNWLLEDVSAEGVEAMVESFHELGLVFLR